jgi:hypothetical protein
LNSAAILAGVSLSIVYLVVSYAVNSKPYDYALLMRGADWYCFDNDAFVYGKDLRVYYPAPFYTTFCLPNRYAEPLLRALWLGIPLGAALWLARGRAAVLAYPPLFILILLGQSSWLLLPAFMLAAGDKKRQSSPWWHGLALALCVFKPHIALPVVVYLLYRWWKQHSPAFYVAIVGMIAVCIPAFLIRPTWLAEWLPSGRGFEPVNLASIAFVPVQLAGLGFAPGTGGQVIVYSFCALVGVGLFVLLRRQGHLTLYDWVLLFFFVNPFLNDYDLIVLLPFITQNRRRLLVALVGGVVSWVFALMTLRWSMSFMVLLPLLVMRLWKPETQHLTQPDRIWNQPLTGVTT